MMCTAWHRAIAGAHLHSYSRVQLEPGRLSTQLDRALAFGDQLAFRHCCDHPSSRVPDEHTASWKPVPGGPWLATRKYHGPFKEIENRQVVYRISIAITNTPITAGGKVMVDGAPSTTRNVPSKLNGQLDFEVELDCTRYPPMTVEIPLIKCCAFSPLPIPTSKQLVEAFPRKLNSTAKMLYDQLPSFRFVDPDTGRDHNLIPIAVKRAVYAEVRALERAAIAAQHARDTANPDASHRETMTAMLRAAKLSAYPPHETLDATQQSRLCAIWPKMSGIATTLCLSQSQPGRRLPSMIDLSSFAFKALGQRFSVTFQWDRQLRTSTRFCKSCMKPMAKSSSR